ncbi:MAG: glycosyltransferase [Gammaproteobacteria bacterium]|nr:glycosyltransferase [Gammaproteobacteria bacterium]MBT8444855.1 glycosyltransferase [Gammaproteobacteria bacterium]
MTMISEVGLQAFPIDRYAPISNHDAVEELRELAVRASECLAGQAMWHVNSTAAGGGVAEMLPSMLGYCRDLGIDARWLVINGEPDFFQITKRLHHALHGERGDGTPLDDEAHRIYERTMEENAADILSVVRPRDIVILHDPQTIGLAEELSRHGAIVIWRCHIGQSEIMPEAEAAWDFLAPYLRHARRYVFSREAYIPAILDHARCRIVQPTIDPFSAKNQELDDDTVRTILVHTGILARPLPHKPNYEFQHRDGSIGRVDRHADIVRCGRSTNPDVPLIVQVSRWDPLKDPIGVMHGFVHYINANSDSNAELLLVGPSVRSVADDPESPATFQKVFSAWCDLHHWQRDRVHLIMLPMVDIEENAVIVNALQRHASIIVQKSLQEGFGLTVTEAMWKGRPVIASRVGGIQDQITHGKHGLLIDEPTDLEEFSRALEAVMNDPECARNMGAAGRERVRDEFLQTRSVFHYMNLAIEFCGGQDQCEIANPAHG